MEQNEITEKAREISEIMILDSRRYFSTVTEDEE